MKKLFKIYLLAILVGVGSVYVNEARSQTANVSFSVFYNSLKPYGRWMNNSTYGQVWISNDRNFVPYSTGGHWAYTDYGWTWVSDYDWGWAPFHYGRWNYNDSYGWYWVPGYEWAPAWVAWRGGGDYYGWAPLSPGLSVNVNFNTIPVNWWVFAPNRYITSPSISRYYVPRTRNVTIIRNTTVVNNVTVRNNVHYVAGPRRQDVEKVSRTKIKTYTVSNSSKPGRTVVNNNTVNVYRPAINHNNAVVINKNSNNNTTVNKKAITVNKKVKRSDEVKVNNKQPAVNANRQKAVSQKDDKATVNRQVNKINKKATANKQAVKANKNEVVKKQQSLNTKPVNNQFKNQVVKKNQQKVKPAKAVKPQQKQKNNDVAKRKHSNDENKLRR